MIHYKRKQLINEMIEQAVREEIQATGFANEALIDTLRKAMPFIARSVGARITGDVGRMRRLMQLCRYKATRK